VAVQELVVIFLGPRQLWIVARIGIEATLTGARVEQMLAETACALEDESPFISRIDLVPAKRWVP